MFVKMLLAKEIESYIYGLEPSDHVILFYDTLEGKRNILYRFLADGLGKKKALDDELLHVLPPFLHPPSHCG